MKSRSCRLLVKRSVLSVALLQLFAAPLVHAQSEISPEYRWWATQVKSNSFHGGSYSYVEGSVSVATSSLGRGITIAVVDTGVSRHSEYSDRLLRGYSDWGGDGTADGNGHGTHVAGIAAAGLNGSGIAGIAPEAWILPVKVLSDQGSGSGTTLYRGVNWAVNNYVKPIAGPPNRTIFSMSLGGTKAFGLDSLRLIKNSGSIAVVAAGNSGGSNPIYPARYATDASVAGSVLVVGAVDSQNRMTSWSNRAGSTANYYLVAPGLSIDSTFRTSDYQTLSGTSMATPMVSGAAALVWGAWPYLPPTQVVNSLLWSATDLGTPGIDTTFGWGLLNLQAAMKPIGPTCVATGSNSCVVQTSSSSPNASSGKSPVTRKTVSRRSFSRSFALPSAAGVAGVEAGQRVIGYDSLGRHFGFSASSLLRSSVSRSVDVLDQWLLNAQPIISDTGRTGDRLLFQGSRASGLTGLSFSQPMGTSGDAWLNMFRGGSVLPFGAGHKGSAPSGFVGNDNMKIPQLGLIEDPTGMSYRQSFYGGAVSTRFGLVTGFSTTPTDDLIRTEAFVSKPSTSAALGEIAYLKHGFEVVLTMGSMNEAGSFLGAAVVTDKTSGQGSFASISATYHLGSGVSLMTSMTHGNSQGRVESGDARYEAQTKAVSFGLMKKSLFARDDVMTASWSQPNRIEKGQIALHAAVDVSMDTGAPIFGVVPVSMVPSGREQRFTLGWTSPIGKQGALGLTAMRRFEPNHNALAKPENVMGLRFTRDF
jgi:hypothetical protein